MDKQQRVTSKLVFNYSLPSHRLILIAICNKFEDFLILTTLHLLKPISKTFYALLYYYYRKFAD